MTLLKLKKVFQCALTLSLLSFITTQTNYIFAQAFPSRPINVVVPFAPGGQNDRIARSMAPYLQKYLGQPVTVINKAGAGAQLGHTYFLQQPDDGYTILSSSVNYIPLNIGITKAPYKLQDFEMVNLPSNDSTILATSSDSRFKTIEQVMDSLKKDPKSVSVGVQPASADLLNLALLLQAEKINIKDVRVVTFTGGGPARNAVLGGTVDVGLVGAEGFIPVKNRIRGLVLFDDQRDPEFADTVNIEEYAKKRSLSIEWVPGSQRGWAVPTSLKNKYPDRHAILVKAISEASRDPEYIAAAKTQSLPVTWLGPQKSQELYLKSSEILLKHIDLILAK